MENKGGTMGSKRRMFRSRNLFLFLVFVVISFFFWSLLALNDVINKDVELTINIKNLPEDVTFINEIPSTISVSVNDKGASLLKYSLGNTPVLDLDFNKYVDGNIFRVPASNLHSVVRDKMGGGANIFSFEPDSISALFTNMPGKVVPIKINALVSTNYQYIQCDDIKIVPDSVTVYGSGIILSPIEEVATELFAAEELTDTLFRTVKLKSISNARLSPQEVTVTIPVEQLISKKQNIPIITNNVPDSVRLITFPSSVVASYLVPKSSYNQIDGIYAEVDYKEVGNSVGNKLKISVKNIPADYKQLFLDSDSVEFIIDKR